MTTWVALLRGVNVGGNRRVAMADLRQTLAKEGCGRVRTYLQSGNAVVDWAGGESDLVSVVAAALERDFGFPVDVVVRPAAEVVALSAENPFLAAGAAGAQLHVLFPAVAPTGDALAALGRFDAGADRFAAVGRNVFLLLPHGVTGARLTYLTLARYLGTGTVRNWNTVTKLVAALQS